MCLLILGLVQRALRLQYRQQGFGTGPITAFRQGKGDSRLLDFLILPLALVVHAADGVEGFLDVGETGNDAGAIVLQQLLLPGLGFIPFGTQAAIVEDWRGQAGSQGVIGAAQDTGEGICSGPQVGTQGKTWQHRCAGNLNVGLGRS
ncbi:hypothetical protein D3C77_416840 [compost metagenome]